MQLALAMCSSMMVTASTVAGGPDHLLPGPLQTTGTAKNTLTIMTADVVKVRLRLHDCEAGRRPLHCTACRVPTPVRVRLQPRVAAGEVIRAFNESNKSPYIKRQQTIYHPGEVSA